MRRLRSFAVAVALAGGASPPVRAEAPATQGEVEAMEEARHRFQRGVDLYKEGDLEAAFVELKRAYELVPTYKVLYNLGQVSYQRRDHASALRYFRRYLGEGAEAIPVPRQHEVAADIVRLEERVGRLEIDGAEDGAEVLVDDGFVGRTPLHGPVLVNGGRRKVDLVATAGGRQTRVIEIAGGETVRVAFSPLMLKAPSAPPSEPATMSIAPLLAPAATAVAVRTTPERRFPWKAWTFTALLAGGAAATGALAWLSKRQLDQELATFPADPYEIDHQNQRVRDFALATDGLLIGTAVMAALSLYLTYRDPK